jgi:hypothetical protein
MTTTTTTPTTTTNTKNDPNVAFMTSADFLNNNADLVDNGGVPLWKRLALLDPLFGASAKRAAHAAFEAQFRKQLMASVTDGADAALVNAQNRYVTEDSEKAELTLIGANNPARANTAGSVDGVISSNRSMPTGHGNVGIRI